MRTRVHQMLRVSDPSGLDTRARQRKSPPMTAMSIAIGGAIGAVLRYLAILVFTFPFGTIVVNVLGSFLIGVAFVCLLQDKSLGRYLPFAMTGVLGGFTTFSTFSLDTLILIEKGAFGTALAYVFGTVALCLLACAAGLWLTRWVVG